MVELLNPELVEEEGTRRLRSLLERCLRFRRRCRLWRGGLGTSRTPPMSHTSTTWHTDLSIHSPSRRLFSLLLMSIHSALLPQSLTAKTTSLPSLSPPSSTSSSGIRCSRLLSLSLPSTGLFKALTRCLSPPSLSSSPACSPAPAPTARLLCGTSRKGKECGTR